MSDSESESFHSADDGDDHEPVAPTTDYIQIAPPVKNVPSANVSSALPGNAPQLHEKVPESELLHSELESSGFVIEKPKKSAAKSDDGSDKGGREQALPKKSVPPTKIDATKETEPSSPIASAPQPQTNTSPSVRPISLFASKPVASTTAKPITDTQPTKLDTNTKAVDHTSDWDVGDWDNEEDESLGDAVHMTSPQTCVPDQHAQLVLEDNTPKHTQPQNPLDRLAEPATAEGSSWSSWGTLFTAATDSIGALKSTVGDGLTDAFAAGLGIESPEESARLHKEQIKDTQIDAAEETPSQSQNNSHVTHLLPGVVRQTGSSLISGSLDVLESIGKKTFDALTVSDEEQKRRRSILSNEQPNLSQILKERKQSAESEMISRQMDVELKACNYAYQFEAFEAEETEQDFEGLIKEVMNEISVPYTAGKLIQVQRKRWQWIQECIAEQDVGIPKVPNDLFKTSVQTLAEFTARCVETQHKVAQLLLIAGTAPHPTTLVNLIQMECTQVGVLCNALAQTMNTAADDTNNTNTDSLNPLLTALFLEANNSCNYIRETLRLMQPVLECTIRNQSQ